MSHLNGLHASDMGYVCGLPFSIDIGTIVTMVISSISNTMFHPIIQQSGIPALQSNHVSEHFLPGKPVRDLQKHTFWYCGLITWLVVLASQLNHLIMQFTDLNMQF